MKDVKRNLHRWLGLAVIALLITGLSVLPCCAQEEPISDNALKLLKKSLDYVQDQNTYLLTFESDIEVVTPEVQKIQFTSSGKMLLQRPDKLYVARAGGYSDIEVYLEGKTLTVYGKNLKVYAQTSVPGEMAQVIEKVRSELGLDLPGADLFLTNAYKDLVADVIQAKHIGVGVVSGVECYHLAFRNADTDWQVWIEAGAHPFPRKYVVTSKNVAAAPQYTLIIKGWETDVKPAQDVFSFKPPSDAKQVDFKSLVGLDEVPPSSKTEGAAP